MNVDANIRYMISPFKDDQIISFNLKINFYFQSSDKDLSKTITLDISTIDEVTRSLLSTVVPPIEENTIELTLNPCAKMIHTGKTKTNPIINVSNNTKKNVRKRRTAICKPKSIPDAFRTYKKNGTGIISRAIRRRNEADDEFLYEAFRVDENDRPKKV